MTCEVGFVLAGIGMGNTIEYQHKLVRFPRGEKRSFVLLQLGCMSHSMHSQRLRFVSQLHFIATDIETEKNISFYSKTE